MVKKDGRTLLCNKNRRNKARLCYRSGDPHDARQTAFTEFSFIVTFGTVSEEMGVHMEDRRRHRITAAALSALAMSRFFHRRGRRDRGGLLDEIRSFDREIYGLPTRLWGSDKPACFFERGGTGWKTTRVWFKTYAKRTNFWSKVRLPPCLSRSSPPAFIKLVCSMWNLVIQHRLWSVANILSEIASAVSARFQVQRCCYS